MRSLPGKSCPPRRGGRGLPGGAPNPRLLPKEVLEARPYEGKVYVREGKAVGEGYLSPVLGAEALSLYRDFRDEGRARHPLRVKGYLLQGDRWTLFARRETLEARLGVTLQEDLFR